MKIALRITCACAFFCTRLLAQSSNHSESSFDTLSLAELMNIKITVASNTELTQAQSPAIVSTLTSEDLRASGARDLMDALQQIPGFTFAMDVEGVVGLSVRGNWAHEGKVVLVIDGQEMNEGLYSTLQFGNHYPIDHIDRIEIIRGPGSALYGGYAAYAVINVITRSPKGKNEFAVSSRVGSTQHALSNESISVYYGSKINSRASISLSTVATQGERSQGTYTDLYGGSYSMKGQSGLDNYYLNLGSTVGQLGIRCIADLYRMNSRDEYQQSVPRTHNMNFDSYFMEVNRQFSLNEKWKIIARLQYKNQEPWALKQTVDSASLSAGVGRFNILSERYTESLNSSYDISNQLNISAGAQYFTDVSTNQISDQVFHKTNSQKFKYSNSSCFVQSMWKSKWFNLIAGLRYNNNDRYASTVVPRFGVTKEFDQFHVKLLYNGSFRSPSTQNIDLANNIQPEKTNVVEIETGYMFSENSSLNLNAFLITTHDPIIYYFDTLTNFDAYTNASKTGSNGLEMEYRYKKNRTFFRLSGSYYIAKDAKDLSFYTVADHGFVHLGISPFKVSGEMRIGVTKNIDFNFYCVYESSKIGYIGSDEHGATPIHKDYPETFMINFNVGYKFQQIQGLSLMAGVRNALDENYWYLQPYSSFHGALPGMGREFELKLSYQRF